MAIRIIINHCVDGVRLFIMSKKDKFLVSSRAPLDIATSGATVKSKIIPLKIDTPISISDLAKASLAFGL